MLIKQIVIRKGKYYLLNTIKLTSLDSNTIFTNYKNEMVNISGAIPIVKNNNICNWNLYKQKPNNLGIYTCLVNNTNITNMNKNGNNILGLRIDGYRAIRARYPNANPEIDGFGSNLTSNNWLPQNNEHYRLGINSYYCKDHFTPPASWFCNEYEHAKGLVYNSSIFPHAPYKNTSSAVLQLWHGLHWSSWMFEIKDNLIENSTFVFGKGGFQGNTIIY